MISLAYELNPQDFLHFVETDEFRSDWESLGLDVETDLLELQAAIMVAPELSPVIQGTGGLRKVRFSPRHWDSGKRGAVRVCYAYFKEHWTILLIMAYGKNEKGNLSKSEREGVKKYLAIVKKYFDDLNS